MSTKITGLTALNVRALREMDVKAELTATTATFDGRPVDALARLDAVRAQWRGSRRDHPFASTAAVRRKLERLIP
jgi:hypothetical protein